MTLRRLAIALVLAFPMACTIHTATARPVEPQPMVAVGSAPPAGEVVVVEQTEPAPATVVASTGEHPPIVCGGSQDVALDGVTIRGDVAVSASGSCNISLTRCTIYGDTAAIVTSGSADVALRGCVVSAPVAVQASGSSNVVLAGSRIDGQVLSSGSADVVTMQ